MLVGVTVDGNLAEAAAARSSSLVALVPVPPEPAALPIVGDSDNHRFAEGPVDEASVLSTKTCRQRIYVCTKVDVVVLIKRNYEFLLLLK